MDQHLGASITLSFGLVVVFAIVLYQPDHPPLPPTNSSAPSRGEATPAPLSASAGDGSGPPLTPTEPLTVRPVRPASVSVPVVERSEMRPVTSNERFRARVGPERPAAKTAPPPPPPFAPRTGRSGFTQALEGETLLDVAYRLYGTADQAETLWRLNRDMIAARDATLAQGTPLRTP